MTAMRAQKRLTELDLVERDIGSSDDDQQEKKTELLAQMQEEKEKKV